MLPWSRQVIDLMRAQFDEADKVTIMFSCATRLPNLTIQFKPPESFDCKQDGSGFIDSNEAAALFARHCAGSSEAEIRAISDNVRNQLDSDRNGRISFEEYAFRFGRKLQVPPKQPRLVQKRRFPPQGR